MGQCFTYVLHCTNTIFVNLLYIILLREIAGAPTGSPYEIGGIL